MRKFWGKLKYLFLGKPKKPKKKKEAAVEDPQKAMDRFMGTNADGTKNWKPNSGGRFNPWG